MSNYSMNNLPACAATAAVETKLNLLVLMEIFACLWVTHPVRLLQTLDKCDQVSDEICCESSLADFISLRLSPFGRKLKQIH